MAEHGLTAQRVHRLARQVSSSFGQVTSGARMSPAFLIVGAQRGGTTSLHKTLAEHPQVLSAVLHKGVHYFDTSYGRGIGWYRAHFPLTATARVAEGRRAGRVITGESSPYYMFHPLAAERIATDLPDVRLIVMLRDPVERAYSAHSHERARGYETEEFERALELEDSRLAGEEDRIRADPAYVSHAHQHQAYLARGRYVEQLERLERLVGRDRLCVVDSDELFLAPDQVLTSVYEFLGLPPRMNATLEHRNARPRSKMPPSLRRELSDHFEPYDERLAAWWGHTPRWRM